MILEESGQREDDGCDGDCSDVGVRSLYGAESLGVQWSTYDDVPVDCQQYRQPHVHHAQHIDEREHPGEQTAMDVLVVGVVDEWSDIAQRSQQEDDEEY